MQMMMHKILIPNLEQSPTARNGPLTASGATNGIDNLILDSFVLLLIINIIDIENG